METPIEVTETSDPLKSPRSSISNLNLKILIILVIIAGFIVSYVAGYFVARTPPQTTIYTNQNIKPTTLPAPTPKIDKLESCSEKECLISARDSHMYGYAQLEGYYKTYDGTAWERENIPVTCHSIIPTGGSTALLNDFQELINSGNNLNKMIDGQMHINISLNDLIPSDKERLLQSSAADPVLLYVIRPILPGRGVSTCTSYLSIIGIKSIK